MTEIDFDRLGSTMESLRSAWDSLTPEQKADVANKVDSAMTDGGVEEADSAGTSSQSEFQRRAESYKKVGAYLELASVLALLGVVTAPAAPVLAAFGTVFLLFGKIGESITIERARDIGTWLATKHPKSYEIFCNNPGLLYGELAYRRNPEGPWYMMESCALDSDMLTVGPGGIVAPGDITSAASIPDYPSWATDSSLSSSSSSNLIKFGLIAGAAYLILK